MQSNALLAWRRFFDAKSGCYNLASQFGLFDHYQIELVHLNPNSILLIAVFVQLCEAFLGIPLNFRLLKNYFFLKYQSSTANEKIIEGIEKPSGQYLGFIVMTH
jgi:hypothetical protein